MKKAFYFLKIAIIMSCGTQKPTKEQTHEKQIFTKIGFPKGGSQIILNDKPAFNYLKTDNDFEISNLNGEKLISGSISNENGEWKSIIHFLTVDKKFTNSKIIGRNDLIFALANSNVITEEFELDRKKLLEFIEKNNGK